MMSEKKINRVLPLIFRQVKIPHQAKEELRRRLFKKELTDGHLLLVAAAGNVEEQELKKGGNHNDTHGKI